MAHHKTIKGILRSWIQKGDKEKNIFNRFIAYWISLNCFYNAWTESETDFQAIESMAKDQQLIKTYKNSVDKSNVHLFKRFQNVCPIYKVIDTSKRKEISNILNFRQVLWALYQVRCNLIHGGKGEEVKRDNEVMNAATPVLEIIVKCMVQNHF